MRRDRNAKIVATLGPASSSEEEISALFEAGVDVFRMNFSHGDHEGHRERFNILRGLEKKYDHSVAILLDLQGPKLRVGKFENDGVELVAGQNLRLVAQECLGTAEQASLPHPEVFAALEPNTNLLLDDGRLQLKVLEHGSDWAETEVVIGGKLSNHKGLNVPEVVLNVSSLTEKDLSDLRFGLELGVDFIALSFVQRPEDIAEAKRWIAGRAPIITKLEKPQALTRLDEIIDLSDGVMVARGDLGVEVPPEDVPGLQKLIIRKCCEVGKPVIVATQMLDSMISAPTPTRAEASDVATAIYDGADAVMLSAETAVGEYTVESVSMMERIITKVEHDPHYRDMRNTERRAPEATAADAITAAARQVADTISAAVVVTFSTTGSTTLRAARERPVVPILGLTPRIDTARRSALIWGVHSVLTEDCHTFGEMVSKAIHAAKTEGFADSGDPLVITAGVPFGTPGATNILRIAWVE